MSQAATANEIESSGPGRGREQDAVQGKANRLKLFLILGAGIVIAAVAWSAWWYLYGSRYVSTDNAYAAAEIAQITPRVEGTLESVPVRDTLRVSAGDVLATLDQTDAKLAVAEAQANFARARQRVAQYFANVDGAKAQVVSRQSDLARAQTDFKRREALVSSGAVSGDELTSARNALQTAQAAVEATQHQLIAQQALIVGTDADHNPEVLAAKATLDKANVDLERTVIRAPVDGIVAQNTAQIGQHVRPDAPLMAIVPISQLYVDANFKEGQLDHVRPNQPVTLTSDLYGGGVVFHGHIDGLGGGTGSAMAVIPAQNATGNWIKVVQRLPVRIKLDPKELAEHPLRVGLSMTARIDIR